MFALILLAVIVCVGALLYLEHRHYLRRHPAQTAAAQSPQDECCGRHEVCERDTLLQGIETEIEYFDDEELDCYAGWDAQNFTDSDIEAFRDVLYTLQPQDIAPWVRSLEMRKIALHPVLRDELLFLVKEARANADSGGIIVLK